MVAFISGNALRINNAKETKIFKSTRPRFIENIVLGSLLFSLPSVVVVGNPSSGIAIGPISSVSAAETSIFSGI